MSETRVEARDVVYRVGEKTLVDRVSFSAAAGEFIALIGPNGAGKSTLLEIVAGRLRPAAGEIRLLGAPIDGVSTRDLAITRAMLGANPPSDIPFAVRTVVETGRYPFRGLPEATPDEDTLLVDRAMAMADVARLADRSYRTLSSGEQARVMIARVLAQASPIALLDEPAASLDAANGERALQTFSSNLEKETTVICVLHDLNQASFYADRIMLMSEGRLVGIGDPREVLQSEVLSEVYGQTMKVPDHPFRGCPLVLMA
ncbi:MAG: ATP-binding cassette domain-containing protein [Acidimicrobiia bacterium]|jgi:iron complex transport system ATP-binding protein